MSDVFPFRKKKKKIDGQLSFVYSLTRHAWEALGRVDIKGLRVGLGEYRRNIVVDLT